MFLSCDGFVSKMVKYFSKLHKYSIHNYTTTQFTTTQK